MATAFFEEMINWMNQLIIGYNGSWIMVHTIFLKFWSHPKFGKRSLSLTRWFYPTKWSVYGIRRQGERETSPASDIRQSSPTEHWRKKTSRSFRPLTEKLDGGFNGKII
jgi:hypothetical protein